MTLLYQDMKLIPNNTETNTLLCQWARVRCSKWK